MLLAFKGQQVHGVRNRHIDATIRKERKDRKRPRIGEALIMYSGIRTKNAWKIGTAECASVQSIAIDREGFYLEGVQLSSDELDALAKRLGFESYERFNRFWTRYCSLPFFGWLCIWKDYER